MSWSRLSTFWSWAAFPQGLLRKVRPWNTLSDGPGCLVSDLHSISVHMWWILLHAHQFQRTLTFTIYSLSSLHHSAEEESTSSPYRERCRSVLPQHFQGNAQPAVSRSGGKCLGNSSASKTLEGLCTEFLWPAVSSITSSEQPTSSPKYRRPQHLPIVSVFHFTWGNVISGAEPASFSNSQNQSLHDVIFGIYFSL